MKNKINEGSGLWLDLRVDNPENPSCFWNSVRTSSFLDKKGKSRVPFFRKSPLRKIRFPYLVCLWGVRVLPPKSHVSGSVCWEVGDTEAGGARCRRPASAGTLWNEPRADELPNAPWLPGRSPAGFSQKVQPQHSTVLPAVASLALRSPKWVPGSGSLHSSENRYWAPLSPLADLSEEAGTR